MNKVFIPLNELMEGLESIQNTLNPKLENIQDRMFSNAHTHSNLEEAIHPPYTNNNLSLRSNLVPHYTKHNQIHEKTWKKFHPFVFLNPFIPGRAAEEPEFIPEHCMIPTHCLGCLSITWHHRHPFTPSSNLEEPQWDTGRRWKPLHREQSKLIRELNQGPLELPVAPTCHHYDHFFSLPDNSVPVSQWNPHILHTSSSSYWQVSDVISRCWSVSRLD